MTDGEREALKETINLLRGYQLVVVATDLTLLAGIITRYATTPLALTIVGLLAVLGLAAVAAQVHRRILNDINKLRETSQ